LFPEFEQGGNLRFSRLFANAKASLKEQIWWTSKTFKKKGANTEVTKQSIEQEELTAISNLKLANEAKEKEVSKKGKDEKEIGNKKVEEKKDENEGKMEEKDVNEVAEISRSGWDFMFGDLPKKKDCCSDEYVCFFKLYEFVDGDF
jgi:hypothetical protein